MFLSVSARFLVNVEALNMVESVGNVVRHRRAPIIVPSSNKNEYVLVYTPVISGESIANAYQRWMAELAKQENLPVCTNCERAFFVKHGDREIFGDKNWEIKLKEIIERFAERRRMENWNELKQRIMDMKNLVNKVSSHWANSFDEWIKNKEQNPPKRREELDSAWNELRSLSIHYMEESLINNCVVEDIGGFLLPEEFPVKRTSKFQVGFMVPAYDQIRTSALEAQFHVRYAPDPARHSIYYVELGSALYAFHFNIDLGAIGYTSMMKKEMVVNEDERLKRIELAVKALTHMLENKLFGAHLSRHNPVGELRSLVAVVSEPLPFTTSIAHGIDYVEDTSKRAKRFSEIITNESSYGQFINKEGLGTKEVSEERVNLKRTETVSEVFKNIIKHVTEELKTK